MPVSPQSRSFHPDVEHLTCDLTVAQVAEALEALRFRRFKNDQRLVSLDEMVRDYLVGALRRHVVRKSSTEHPIE